MVTGEELGEQLERLSAVVETLGDRVERIADAVLDPTQR
jgi:hypothetical protein